MGLFLTYSMSSVFHYYCFPEVLSPEPPSSGPSASTLGSLIMNSFPFSPKKQMCSDLMSSLPFILAHLAATQCRGESNSCLSANISLQHYCFIKTLKTPILSPSHSPGHLPKRNERICPYKDFYINSQQPYLW